MLRLFVMAAELLLIKFLVIAITVFDLVILIDGVIRDGFAFVEFSIGKRLYMIAPLGNTVVVCGLYVLCGLVQCIRVVGFVATLCTDGVMATL